MNRLVYNWERDELELDGKPVGKGRPLELYVMGYWLSGIVYRDASGWYLLTRDQIGIRLVAGLRARIPDISLIVTLPAPTDNPTNRQKSRSTPS
jgi:hypothetical protein